MAKRTAPREYAVFRVDSDATKTHGWMVNLVRDRRAYAKTFSDGVWGGREKARLAAVAWRDELDRRVPRPRRVAIANVLRPNNTSGVPGVSRHVSVERGNERARWVATWTPVLGGKPKSRTFGVTRYGEERAKELAIAARVAGLASIGDEEHRNGGAGRAKRSVARGEPKARIEIAAYIPVDAAKWLREEARAHGLTTGAFAAQLLVEAHGFRVTAKGAPRKGRPSWPR